MKQVEIKTQDEQDREIRKQEIEAYKSRLQHFSKLLIRLRVINAFSRETKLRNYRYWNLISEHSGVE